MPKIIEVDMMPFTDGETNYRVGQSIYRGKIITKIMIDDTVQPVGVQFFEEGNLVKAFYGVPFAIEYDNE